MTFMMRKFSSGGTIGKFILLIGALNAVPLLVLPFYPEEAKYAAAFAIPALISIILGAAVILLSKQEEISFNWQYTMQSGSLTVLFAWGYGFLTGALPFVFSGQLSFVRALFESISGWTTTGLSVMDVSITPQIFLLHRSFMQFCGGLGFIMMMVMLVQGKQSMNLYNAEGHPDKLMPNLKKTARLILTMYLSFLIAGMLLYVIAGMEPFDSLLHTMCALSTGGFSTKLNSIGEYNSIPIEIVTFVLMLIGTTNFAVLLLLVKRKFKQLLHVSELRFMFVLLLVFVPITAFSLAGGLNMSIGEGFRRALFDVTSALSTTGYSTMPYSNWPPLATGVLIMLMLIGGGMGSTAGGIKMSRIYVQLRATLGNIRKRLTPARNVTAPHYYRAQGKTAIDGSLISDTSGFIACYFLIYITGALLMTLAAKCTLTEALFEFASALGTVGLSIGLTGPATGTGTLVIEMFGMILGRLEIFIVLIGVYSSVSVIKRRLTSKKRI